MSKVNIETLSDHDLGWFLEGHREDELFEAGYLPNYHYKGGNTEVLNLLNESHRHWAFMHRQGSLAAKLLANPKNTHEKENND